MSINETIKHVGQLRWLAQFYDDPSIDGIALYVEQLQAEIERLKTAHSEERKKHVVLEQKFFVQQNERDEAREKHGCVLTVRECRAIVNRLDAQETYGEVNHFSFLNAFDKLQKGANVEVKQEILDA